MRNRLLQNKLFYKKFLITSPFSDFQTAGKAPLTSRSLGNGRSGSLETGGPAALFLPRGHARESAAPRQHPSGRQMPAMGAYRLGPRRFPLSAGPPPVPSPGRRLPGRCFMIQQRKHTRREMWERLRRAAPETAMILTACGRQKTRKRKAPMLPALCGKHRLLGGCPSGYPDHFSGRARRAGSGRGPAGRFAAVGQHLLCRGGLQGTAAHRK